MPLDFLGASRSGYEMGRQTVMDAFEIAELARKRQEQEATRGALSQFMAAPSRESLMSLAQVNPEAAQKMITQQQKRSEDEGRFVLSAYNTLQTAPPSRKNEVFQELKKQANIAGFDTSMFGNVYTQDEMSKLENMARVAAGRYGAPQEEIQAQSKIGKITSDYQRNLMSTETYERLLAKELAPERPLVSVSTGAVPVTPEQKYVSEHRGKQFAQTQDFAATALRENDMLDIMENAVRDPAAYTGALGVPISALKRVGASWGIKVKGETSEAIIKSLGNRLALRLRNPKGEEGLSGNTSDRDLRFLVSSVPGIINTKEQNLALIEAARMLNDRKIEVARMQEDYFERRGTLAGFNEVKRKFVENNPLFVGTPRGEDIMRRLRGEGSNATVWGPSRAVRYNGVTRAIGERTFNGTSISSDIGIVR